MASSQNFRTAFNGFNREDVVHYLEYINTKHTNQLNQLTAENESLRERLERLPDAESQRLLVESLEEKCRNLTGQLEEATSRAQTLERQLAAAQSQCAELTQAAQAAQAAQPEPETGLTPTASDELEAYRRAERIEREAKERSELVYYQANSVLSQTTAKVDSLSADITQMADQVVSQLTQLQAAVSSGKQALQEASSIMGTIRPNQNPNQS